MFMRADDNFISIAIINMCAYTDFLFTCICLCFCFPSMCFAFHKKGEITSFP